MKKVKYKENGKSIVCYQISNEEMLRTRGTIKGIARESERLGAECKVHDNGEEGYTVELIMPQKSWNPFKKKTDNSYGSDDYNKFTSADARFTSNDDYNKFTSTNTGVINYDNYNKTPNVSADYER